MKRTIGAVLAALLMAVAALGAQSEKPEVQPGFDAASWATAAVNPATGLWQAAHSSDQKCQISRWLVSEGILQAALYATKKLVKGPLAERPCFGCPQDGFPSGHAANATMGSIDAWQGNGWNAAFSVSMPVATAVFRYLAHRHDAKQVAAGVAFGFAADWAGHRLVRCP